MEARVLRRIKSGAEFDNLFPKCTGEDISLKQDAGVEDTLRLIIRTVPQTSWHTAKIAQVLKGESLNETCSNIWHFVYEHIQYNKDDDGYEQIRSPRRTWRDRQRGGDCDDYTEFIASILTNLRIPFKPRIAIYDYSRGYQHIYIVVPKDGKLDYELTNRRDYIVIDCVKDAYDDEHPFLETKDYDMKLQYLDGIPGTYRCADAQGFSEVWDGQEFGGLKDLVQKVGSTVKKVADTVIDKAGDALREVNRYANPATILLRNGFLAAMNINLFNVADKIRFAYWTEDQARKANMNIDAWKKLKEIKDRAETIYYQAGGEKAALRKAILEGKGNRDKKVPLSGFFGGFTGYGDATERQILYSTVQGLSGGLGEVVTAAMITAATGAITALGLTIKQVGSLFQKGTPEANTFDNPANGVALPADTGNPGANYTVPQTQYPETNYTSSVNNNAPIQTNTYSPTQDPGAFYTSGGGGLVSNSGAGNSPGSQASYTDNSGSTAVVRVDTPQQTEKGVFGLVKKYPSAFLFGGLAVGTGYFLYRSHQHEKKEAALSGLPQTTPRRKKATGKKRKKRTKKTHSKKVKISAIKL